MKYLLGSAGLLIVISTACNDQTVSKRHEPAPGGTTTERPALNSPGNLEDPDDPCGMTSAFNIVPQAKSYIVGGEEAERGDLVTRSTVKLFIGEGHCTGTLIGENQILTAAHCFESQEDNPGATSIEYINSIDDISIGLGTSGAIDRGLEVTAVLPHPRYRGILGNAATNRYAETVFYDVALVTFSGTLDANYRPVTIGDSDSEISKNTRVTVAGYGVYSENDNQIRPLTAVETRVEEVNEFREIQLQINGKGACYGDSGGPTYVKSQSQSCLKLVGSTTGPGRDSNYSCNDGSGTMMDVTTYKGWIKCGLNAMGESLDYLYNDGSEKDCGANQIIR